MQIKIPATFEGLKTLKDRSCKLVFESQELSSEEAASLIGQVHHFGWLIFASEDETEVEIPIDAPSKLDDLKRSPSERLRSVMYVYYRAAKGTGVGFYQWYEDAIEAKIEDYKDRIEKLEAGK